MAKSSDLYSKCKHIKREGLVHVANDEAISRELSLNYRVIPSFEKFLYEQLFIRHYSLRNNQLLACRWEEYKRNEGRVYGPFQFPSHRDLHFYINKIRYDPSQSNFREADHRMKLKPGPGVDAQGQKPIPNEFLLKRAKTETVNVTVHRQRMKSTKKIVLPKKKYK